jgi:hypothetical protein
LSELICGDLGVCVAGKSSVVVVTREKEKSSRGSREKKAFFCFLIASFSSPKKSFTLVLVELFTFALLPFFPCATRSNERMGTLEKILGVKVDAGQDLSALEPRALSPQLRRSETRVNVIFWVKAFPSRSGRRFSARCCFPNP